MERGEDEFVDRYGRLIQPEIFDPAHAGAAAKALSSAHLDESPDAAEHAAESAAELTPLLNRSASSGAVDESFSAKLATWKRKLLRADLRAWLGFYLPIMHWLPRYDLKNHALRDLLAGVAISMMLIPQGLALFNLLTTTGPAWYLTMTFSLPYSALVGVPPQYGLFTGTVPILVYTLFGQCKQLAVGPDGVSSLLSGQILLTAVAGIAQTDLDMAHAASMLAILIGCWLVLFSIARIGFIENLISRPILDGFVSAAAVTIIIEQSSYIFGIHLHDHEWHKLFELLGRLRETNLVALAIGISFIVFYFVFDFFKYKIAHLHEKLHMVTLVPTTLICVILGIILTTYVIAAEDHHIDVLGTIEPQGFLIPWIPIPPSPYVVFKNMLVPSGTLAIIVFAQSISLGKKYGVIHGYTVTSDRELFALGTINLASGFFRGFPANASLPRTQVADYAGCATQLAGLVAAIILSICIFFFLWVFAPLPKVVIGAIITVAAIRLIEFDFKTYWKIRAWKDIAMFAVAFLASFWLNSIRGILICLALAAYECLSRITAPSLMVLGRDSKGEFHDIKEFTDSRPIEGVSILRVVSPVLFFGNIDQLRNIISLVERLGDPSKLPTSVSQLSHVINVIVLDLAYIIEVDKSAIISLNNMIRDYERRGKLLLVSGLKTKYYDELQILADGTLTAFLPPTVDAAVNIAHERFPDMDSFRAIRATLDSEIERARSTEPIEKPFTEV